MKSVVLPGVLVVVVALAACGGGGRQQPDAGRDAPVIHDAPIDTPVLHDAPVIHDAPPDSHIVIADAMLDASFGTCNVLAQTGCTTGQKCTWLVDQYTPQYVGHIGCAPDGSAAIGASCQFGAAGVTGYDNCVAGAVCGNYAGSPGICKAVCDNTGGTPACDSTHGCVVYSQLFAAGGLAAAGVCDVACDPLADNDFDGSGSALTRTGSACGSANIGCYGYPTGGSPPATVFTCSTDLHYGTPLTHRTECSPVTGCEDADGTLYVNACNQGYLPLLTDSTASSSVDCIAMCKPANCYAGNCGPSDSNQHGQAPHRCQEPDALGSFNTAAAGEECAYWWDLETDQSGALLPSQYSNSTGFCFDHSKYMYDSNNDGVPDKAYPPCQQLQIHATGTNPSDPLTYFGAADLGCVDSGTAGLFTGKRTPPLPGLRGLYHPTRR